jgi:hypothetical protein
LYDGQSFDSVKEREKRSFSAMEVFSGEIPEFPQFKELSLNEKPFFGTAFQQFSLPRSEFTFINLFIWRHPCKIQMTRLKKLVCLLSGKMEDPFFFPMIGVGDVIEYLLALLHYSKEKGWAPKVDRVPEQILSRIDGKRSNLMVRPDRDRPD